MSTEAPELSSELTLFGSWLCPFNQRVWITLHEKGVPFHFAMIDLKDKPKWFLELNPEGKVPVIGYKDDNDTYIINESLTLVEFLEDLHPSPSIFPSHPAQKAYARNLVGWFGGAIPGPFFQTLRSANKEAFITSSQALSKALSELQSKMKPGGPFFLGEQFSIVDAVVVPFLVRQQGLKHYRGFDSLAGVPELAAYVERLKQHPSIQKTLVAPNGDWTEEITKAYAGVAGEPVNYVDE